MKGDCDQSVPSRRRPIWPPVLYICLLSAGVFAAWQLRPSWRERTERHASRKVHPPSRQMVEEFAWPGSRPEELAGNPLRSAGLEPLDGDPGGIAPPPGAVRRMAFRRLWTNEIQEHAGYDWAGDLAAAEEHYLSATSAAGFRLLNRSPDPSGGRILVFSRFPAQAVVALRPYKKEGTMTQVAVTVIHARH